MQNGIADEVRRTLRAIPDYPKPGIVFQDITPVLRDAALFKRVIEALAEPFRGARITHVMGIEARGFILAAPVAITLNAGFLPARKPGKLPWQTVRQDYALEYGTDALEAHLDACSPPPSRVLVVDDVLATGGTAKAAGELVRSLGGELVGWSFLMELGFLPGREKLHDARVQALLAL